MSASTERAKRAFEQDRDEILDSLPADYKNMFGQIGFTKWSTLFVPVLILNPYNTPGGPSGMVSARNSWLTMYNMQQAHDGLDGLSYLVYFYGAQDPSAYYALVKKNVFVPYARIIEPSLCKEIQQKIDSGAPLSSKEKQVQRQYQEMEEDLPKSPRCRIRGITEFLEDYEIQNEEQYTMRRIFVQERNNLLASLPQDYKNMFGQIGFTKWSKSLIPVLILNPYDTPGGDTGFVRNKWLEMYQKLHAQDRLESLSYVVYFYGAEDPNIYYGFVQRKQFISYEREKAKGNKSVHKLPEKISKKIDSGEALSAKDKDSQRAYAEMEEDLLNAPQWRIRGVTQFLEEYQM